MSTVAVVKERPILFKSEMVRAILEGRKTQTRRVVKFEGDQPKTIFPLLGQDKEPTGEWFFSDPVYERVGRSGNFCPYGKTGDRLWVKESSFIWGRWIKDGLTESGRQRWRFKVETPHTVVFDPSHPQVAKKTTPRETCMYWRRPSIFMPRWASRITLEITDVRIHRLRDISEEDALAEGCDGNCPVGFYPAYKQAPRGYHFAQLWESINGEESWKLNPWIWAVTFAAQRKGE